MTRTDPTPRQDAPTPQGGAPTLVAFYQDTPLSGTIYADHAKRLRAECKSVDQPASIVKRNYGTDYLDIVRAKPRFMLEQLDKRNENLLYVDVDSTVLRAWDYPPSDKIMWAEKPNGRPYGHVHYLPNTTATRDFLNTWLEVIDNGWEGGDHSAMWYAIDNTGVEWEPIPNVGARIRHGISIHDGARAAQQHLETIGWEATLKMRLNQ